MKIRNKYNSKAKIDNYAKNLLIALSDDEIDILIKELDEVILGLNDFYKLNCDHLEPTNYIFDNINNLRNDEVKVASKTEMDLFKANDKWDQKYIKVK
ncbi:MAG: Asp-tRNA(Asn)/Glu-tRNA(Gln) amidotransferase subunit GatC [Mycoplasmoidaceae bacterium]